MTQRGIYQHQQMNKELITCHKVYTHRFRQDKENQSKWDKLEHVLLRSMDLFTSSISPLLHKHRSHHQCITYQLKFGTIQYISLFLYFLLECLGFLLIRPQKLKTVLVESNQRLRFLIKLCYAAFGFLLNLLRGWRWRGSIG